MKPKDSKAFVFFILFSTVLWQFGEVIKKLFLKNSWLSNPVFSISYAENKGGAWSILDNQILIFIVVAIFVSIILFWYVYKKLSFKDKFPLLSISIIFAGILGNLVERIQFGYVIDYIKLNFINFPIFNLFDVMIISGFILYFIYDIYNETKNGKRNNNN